MIMKQANTKGIIHVSRYFLLGVFLYSFISVVPAFTSAYAAGADLDQIRGWAKAEGICLNNDGWEEVHNILETLKSKGGKVDREMAVEAIKEASASASNIVGKGKCAIKKARKLKYAKHVTKRIPGVSIVIGMIFFAENCRAEGACYATTQLVPFVDIAADVVIEGNKVISSTADLINQKLLDSKNGDVVNSHRIAAALVAQFFGGFKGIAIGPTQCLNEAIIPDCYQVLYDYVQSKVYLELNQKKPKTINAAFINSIDLRTAGNAFQQCLNGAKKECPKCAMPACDPSNPDSDASCCGCYDTCSGPATPVPHDCSSRTVVCADKLADFEGNKSAPQNLSSRSEVCAANPVCSTVTGVKDDGSWTPVGCC